ncbi:DUF1614 domain-containing protein [Thermosulfuriphilus ammonigenes]|uniref:DUF1614 domain-containing protein n=1 Tax=Thermosulfuriphilus ammonigenes TaxID=1936021 RepID=A0A6G7PWH1_9BACT|nr:DUF1614 domain-containing protein [Thermosulfuriphilus ammonigenes]MBA2847763.1 putative membrane protein [Thermosulfuriphilus ammonigenes]QIJ72034.1 DUF1614 domain-containing protein [Thermosulfuriphilus ammonigenes]
MIFNPFALIFFLFFLILLLFLFAFIHIGLITVAFEKLGLSPFQIWAYLFLSLLGSSINIPLRKVRTMTFQPPGEIVFFGIRYRIPPRMEERTTVIAVNVGGCLIPVLLSLYLTVKLGMLGTVFLGTIVVALVVYFLARPVPGLGIAIPIFIPPILAALVGLILSPEHSAALAYAAGSLGTLLGADIFHLRDIPRLGAPVASIGGAGTFDGIFLTGIIAVLIA